MSSGVKQVSTPDPYANGTSAPVQTTTTASATTTSTTTTAVTTTSVIAGSGVAGDANGDGEVDFGDIVLIMQSLANPNKYQIAPENRDNADVHQKGNGITDGDALTIQKYLLKH